MLTGKYNQPSNEDNNRLGDRVLPHQLEIADTVVQVAKEIGCSPSQLALAWLKAQSDTIIPIFGARKLSQFQDNLDCLEVKISPEQLQRLNEISKIEPGFPHDFR